MMMRLLGLMFVGLLLMAAAAQADTTWVQTGIDLSGDWSLAGSPYMIMGNAHVAARDTLRISRGVQILFHGSFGFIVEGVLLAAGGDADSVVFTADTVAFESGWGGLRFLRPSGASVLDHVLIEHGYALASGDYGYGGGIFCDQTNLVMRNSTVRNCRAYSGQGMCVTNHSMLTMDNCKVSYNGSLSGFGGGMYIHTMSTVTLTNTSVKHNVALYGGGIALDGSTITLQGCDISKNSANISGGGIFSSSATVIVSYSTFLANNSMGGGGIDGRFEMYLTMDHCLLESNIAQRQGAEGPGGGLALAGGQQRVTNCTFVNNAAGQGGAVWAGTATRLENCIFAYQVSGGGVQFPYGGAVVQFCCFAGNNEGNYNGSLTPDGLGRVAFVNANGDSCDQYQNLFLDPHFDDTLSVRYRLTAGSPCINAGSPVTPHDPDGTIADMGAFYYNSLDAGEHFNLHPASFSLTSYPNPFNPSTTLRYDIARTGFVSLKIFDMLGRQVATLVSGQQSTGSYEAHWNAAFEPSGSYFAVLESSGERRTQRLLLLK